MPTALKAPSLFTIYSIHDPDTREPFYIGQTTDLARRVRDHLRTRDKAHSAERIAALLERGVTPFFRILHQTTSRQEADDLEWREIGKHINAGHTLSNAASEINAARIRGYVK